MSSYLTGLRQDQDISARACGIASYRFKSPKSFSLSSNNVNFGKTNCGITSPRYPSQFTTALNTPADWPPITYVRPVATKSISLCALHILPAINGHNFIIKTT